MVELKNLSFGFKDKPIFEDLSLHFPGGAITGIVGKNGVGKTTFFRVLTGRYTPVSGQVLWENAALPKKDISFLPTEPFFYPYMKGMEYIDLVVTGEQNQQCREYARQLQLPLGQLVDTYSTGMKKKLAFSAIISQDRPIQILDEPFNGVDLESNEIIKYILQRQKKNKVVLLSSHILSTLTDICDRIYFIEEGFRHTCYEQGGFDQLATKIREDIHKRMDHSEPE